MPSGGMVDRTVPPREVASSAATSKLRAEDSRQNEGQQKNGFAGNDQSGESLNPAEDYVGLPY